MQVRAAVKVLCSVALLLGATVAHATAVYYVYADQIDTPRVIVRPSDNQVVWRWDGADPFGASQPNTNPAGIGVFVYNLRFPGQLYDAETGTHYNYFRTYDPAIGRYVHSDPIGLKGGVNTFLYAKANPMRRPDPRGLQAIGAPTEEELNRRSEDNGSAAGGYFDPEGDVVCLKWINCDDPTHTACVGPKYPSDYYPPAFDPKEPPEEGCECAAYGVRVLAPWEKKPDPLTPVDIWTDAKKISTPPRFR
jgi:RHS repeat-associated protein